jgi:hypothetical protein
MATGSRPTPRTPRARAPSWRIPTATGSATPRSSPPPPGTPATDPANPDTDGDGLLDSEELAPAQGQAITNPALADDVED